MKKQFTLAATLIILILTATVTMAGTKSKKPYFTPYDLSISSKKNNIYISIHNENGMSTSSINKNITFTITNNGKGISQPTTLTFKCKNQVENKRIKSIKAGQKVTIHISVSNHDRIPSAYTGKLAVKDTNNNNNQTRGKI